jgi:hypothetical protein
MFYRGAEIAELITAIIVQILSLGRVIKKEARHDEIIRSITSAFFDIEQDAKPALTQRLKMKDSGCLRSSASRSTDLL